MPAIFLLTNGTQLQEMHESPYESEELLQKLLADFPSILAGDQFDGEEPKRWLLVSREASVLAAGSGVGRWSMDHIFLDQDGTPTLVEVKRSSDTRIRREVVGQLLEYASNAIVSWPVGHMCTQFRKRFASDEAANGELARFLQLNPEQEESDVAIDTFWKRADDNLHDGNIRLIFVSDEVPHNLRRIVEFLNAQMQRAEVLAIEIKQFKGPGGVTTLVPTVIGQTEQTAAKANRRAGAARTPTPEFLAVIDAYDTARGDEPPTWGTASLYRHVKVPGWPSPLKYEFSCRDHAIRIMLRVALELYPGLATILAPFSGKTLAGGKSTLRWDPDFGEPHKGALVGELAFEEPPETIARAMLELISMTKDLVSAGLDTKTGH
jgi:hypothetical protein